jgi:hypothetical protein
MLCFKLDWATTAAAAFQRKSDVMATPNAAFPSSQCLDERLEPLRCALGFKT